MNSVAAAQLLVQTLVSRGVRQFVLSPGSRSAPLAYALAAGEDRGELELHVRLDERGAAFFALGLAKGARFATDGLAGAVGEPVALVCTSGTAVANYHPAVLEADLARVPLILLTADRPAELRGVLASQTVDQVGIFGTAVRGCLDIYLTEGDSGHHASRGAETQHPSAASIVAAANWAYELATDPAKPGPVHLNLQYREPLHPADAAPAVFGLAQHDGEWRNLAVGHSAEADGDSRHAAGSEAETRNLRPSATQNVRARGEAGEPYLPGDPAKTLVIAGDGAGPIARQVAEANGWPLLAEPTSGALSGPNQVVAYRYLLPILTAGAHPDAVPQHAIVFGRPTLNRAVIKFLSNKQIAVTVVTQGGPPWPDAWRNTARFIPGISPRNQAANEFLSIWQTASTAAAEVIQRVTNQPLDSEFGPLVLASKLLAAPGTLIVGASNPIRDLDLVTGADPEASGLKRIMANRGVAGIDGTIATALGVAIALSVDTALGTDTELSTDTTLRAGPAAEASNVNRLYLGDLAFFHDVSSLIVGYGEQRPQLQIIVANDHGGSIFTGLEHGEWAASQANGEKTLKRVFTTPQAARIEALCAGFGVRYAQVNDLKSLRAALANPDPGVEVVEVQLTAQNRQSLNRYLAGAIGAALGAEVLE